MKRLIRLVLLVLLAAGAYLARDQVGESGEVANEGVRYGEEGSPATGGESPPSHAFAEGEERILEAFARGQSDFVTSIEAKVIRKLADDNEGSRHQKFIIELSGGHTLLVAHNIDLAERVPVQVGDVVQIKGEYEFNGRGGVLHWTHRAHGRNHEEGWIEHRGVRYW